jgi:hypothetical protein
MPGKTDQHIVEALFLLVLNFRELEHVVVRRVYVLKYSFTTHRPVLRD